MSQTNRPKAREATETIRTGWLKTMYVANLLVSLPLGTAVLIAPDTMRSVLGIPVGDPVHYGIAAGALPLAFGLAGIGGLRFPVRFSPVLGVQFLYKTLFLIGGILPMVFTGTVPGYATPVIVIFLLFILGNAIAIPFRYLFSRPSLEYRGEGHSRAALDTATTVALIVGDELSSFPLHSTPHVVPRLFRRILFRYRHSCALPSARRAPCH